MMRPSMMFAAMLAMLTAVATAHAKMEMRTFPVLAGAGAHDVYPAPDGEWRPLGKEPLGRA
jgi:streptogramin lyase